MVNLEKLCQAVVARNDQANLQPTLYKVTGASLTIFVIDCGCSCSKKFMFGSFCLEVLMSSIKTILIPIPLSLSLDQNIYFMSQNVSLVNASVIWVSVTQSRLIIIIFIKSIVTTNASLSVSYY